MTFPVELPPSPFIREVAELFDEATPSCILDVGCGAGRNSIYLAKLGHETLGVTNKLADAQAASEVARNIGLEVCRFVVGDARNLPLRKPFDVVLVNELLQQMTKLQSNGVLRQAQSRTRQGGLNIVSGYIVDPDRANQTNRERCFVPGELKAAYTDAGWDILSYAEDEFAFQPHGNQQLVHSLAKIVAQRPWVTMST